MAKALGVYVLKYIDRHREALRGARVDIGKLHDLAVDFGNALRHHERVLSAYAWHKMPFGKVKDLSQQFWRKPRVSSA